MAWIEPKTNWNSSDGVRDTDLNRIEGNLLYLYNEATVQADKTVYVRTTGTDTDSSGSSSQPYKTISYALSTLPKNLNGKTVALDIGTGEYPEDIVVKGFSGAIILKGAYNRKIYINSLIIEGCVCLIQSLDIDTTNAIVVTNGATFFSNSNVSVNGATYGVTVSNGSTFIVDSSFAAYNASTAGIFVTGASKFYALVIAGNGSTAAAIVDKGSVLAYSTTNMTVNATQYITRNGGRVYTGAQSSLPTY